MNKLFIAALMTTSTFGALAQGTALPTSYCVSPPSRSEVIGEIAKARANGALVAGEATVVDDNFVSHKTRAEVVGEIAKARANGTLPVAGEATLFLDDRSASQRNRAEVLAEVAKARADGTLPRAGEATQFMPGESARFAGGRADCMGEIG